MISPLLYRKPPKKTTGKRKRAQKIRALPQSVIRLIVLLIFVLVVLLILILILIVLILIVLVLIVLVLILISILHFLYHLLFVFRVRR